MKIIKTGKVVLFRCVSCGCEFVSGINSTDTPDRGENYYCNCPCCGAECHANCNAAYEVKKGTKEVDA